MNETIIKFLPDKEDTAQKVEKTTHDFKQMLDLFSNDIFTKENLEKINLAEDLINSIYGDLQSRNSNLIRLRLEEDRIFIDEESETKEVEPINRPYLIDKSNFIDRETFIGAVEELENNTASQEFKETYKKEIGVLPKGYRRYKYYFLDYNLPEELKIYLDKDLYTLKERDWENISIALGVKTKKKTDIIKAETGIYYKTARYLDIQKTKGRRKGQDLFSLLSEDGLKLSKELKLLSSVTSGIVTSALENKTIKYIQKELFAQSKGYNNGDGGGLPDDILQAENLKRREETQNQPFICLDIFQATKEILGRDVIGGSDVNRIIETLKKIDGKFFYDDEDKAFYRLMTIQKYQPSNKETGNRCGRMFIACGVSFKRELENNFINTRSDELKLLSGISSDMSLRLYDILKILESYNTPTQRKKGFVSINKTKLLEQLAVNKSYDKQRGRLLNDFDKAVKDCIKIGIIIRAEEEGNNIKFYFSKDWRK